jgi:ubiquinone/menaquinone biosynthesis C-methylase UbiE
MAETEKAVPMVVPGSKGLIDQNRIISQLGIKNGMIIADLGCGAGYFTIPIARMMGNTGKVYAVDVLTSALESVVSQAKLYGLLNVERIRANVEIVGGTKIEDGKVDMVIMANILFQCDDKDGVFQEAKRILAPGGKIVVIDWVPNNAALGPKYEHCISEETAKTIAIKNGLKVVEKLRAGVTHYGFILQAV